MTRLFFLFPLYLLAITPVHSQTRAKFKWINPELQSLISPLCGRFIAFSKRDNKPLELTPDSITKRSRDLHATTYDMDYQGHRALFKEQYGQSFPEITLLNKLHSLIKPGCDYHILTGKIYRDSIIIIREQNCPVKEDDKIFLPVDRKIGYPGGRPAFQQYLKSFITPGADLLPGQKDSTLYLMVILKKDSLIHEVKLLEPATASPFSDLMSAALMQTKGWTPGRLEGRGISLYVSMFIRLRSDGSVEADFKRYY
jgi:hypothetical protein